mmetsp:Transcript_8856/g.25532  ORF Transcript_8856/g.25532 Transcript_8856/m.25532 type:complete len:254 (-) Transcript_8856:552-1313(-)
MDTRSCAVGNGTYSNLSRRPGLIMAGSISSGRLVAAITKTLRLLSSPSISVSSWFTTRSLTPPPPPPSLPRRGHNESSSSKNTTQGLELRARSNTRRTERSLSPTYLSSSSGPFTLMKLAPLSLAIALASNVFPHPGGPYSMTPAGRGIPSAWNFSGLRIGSSTLSTSSSRMLPRAPMSSHDTSGTVANPSRLLDGCTCGMASRKSDMPILSGSICSFVSGTMDAMSSISCNLPLSAVSLLVPSSIFIVLASS